MKCLARFLCPLVLVISLAGCGGSGGGNVAGGGGGSDVSAGPFQFKGQMNTPSFTSTSGASVYALSGAITKAVLSDANPTIDETEIIAYVDDIVGKRIVAMSPTGTGVRTIATVTSATSIRATTSWVYFLDAVAGQVKRVPLAGGTPTVVKAGVNGFDVSTDGLKIVYHQLSPAGYFYSNSDGTSPTLINTDATAYTFIGFASPTAVMARSGTQVYSLNLSAASSFTTQATYVGMQAISVQSLSGTVIFRDSGSSYYYVQILNSQQQISPKSSFPDLGLGGPIAISPDGKEMAVMNGSNVNVFQPGFQSVQTVFQAFSAGDLTWSPFISQRQFIPSSTYSIGCAAVVFSELGNRVPAVVFADATTRTSMTTTRVSVDGSENVVYRLDCDQLTKLHYSRGGGFALTAVVSSGTGLKGAYVSINAETGEAASVLTFSNRPIEKRLPGRLQLDGDGMEFIPLTTKASKRPVSSITL